MATLKGYTEVVRMLLDKQPSLINSTMGSRGGNWSLLHYAVYSESCEIAQMLLEKGANVEALANVTSRLF